MHELLIGGCLACVSRIERVRNEAATIVSRDNCTCLSHSSLPGTHSPLHNSSAAGVFMVQEVAVEHGVPAQHIIISPSASSVIPCPVTILF